MSQIQPSVSIEKNNRLASTANKAHAALQRAINALASKAQSPTELVQPILDTRTRKGPQNLKALQESSRSDAETIWQCHGALKRISEEARLRQKAIAEKYQNPGDSEKREFVRTLAEAWCFLSGQMPPLTPENNPFLNLSEQLGPMPVSPLKEISPAPFAPPTRPYRRHKSKPTTILNTWPVVGRLG